MNTKLSLPFITICVLNMIVGVVTVIGIVLSMFGFDTRVTITTFKENLVTYWPVITNMVVLVVVVGFRTHRTHKLDGPLKWYLSVQDILEDRLCHAIEEGYVWFKDSRQLTADEITLVVDKYTSDNIEIDDNNRTVTIMDKSAQI